MSSGEIGGGASKREPGEEARHGIGELAPHLALAAVMSERCAPLLACIGDRDPVQEEALAELRHDAVMLVEHRRRARQEPDATLPVQPAAAVDADVAVPAPVVDLAQRPEHARALVAMHRQDRAEVLEHDEPVLADLA